MGTEVALLFEVLIAARVYIAVPRRWGHQISYSVALVCKRTIPTERSPLVGELNASFWG
jgi:hypothetical protein